MTIFKRRLKANNNFQNLPYLGKLELTDFEYITFKMQSSYSITEEQFKLILFIVQFLKNHIGVIDCLKYENGYHFGVSYALVIIEEFESSFKLHAPHYGVELMVDKNTELSELLFEIVNSYEIEEN